MPQPQQRTEAVRSFNRFYTRQIGLLRESFLKTSFSLTQARVLYELGERPGVLSSELCEELGLDPGYLSRLLKRFEQQELLRRSASEGDRRSSQLTLTAKGRKEFERLNARSAAEVDELLAAMSSQKQRELVRSMTCIRKLLGSSTTVQRSFTLRTHKPGDIGWVVARHGEAYANEYDWDVSFEGFVAEIAGNFLLHLEPQRERCWIAESSDGDRLGCVFLVKQSQAVAKLRLLLVEQSARGMGVGTALVSECVAFASQCGYRKLTLWTNDILTAARHLYEQAGFMLVKEEKHHSFGHDLIGQFWELKLR